MPVYCYECECGKARDAYRNVDKRNEPIPCECGKSMQRAQFRESVASTDQEYARPVFSESLGVHPSQVREAQARHPWMKYQPDGTIRIDSHNEYKKVRKALGFFDRAGYD